MLLWSIYFNFKNARELTAHGRGLRCPITNVTTMSLVVFGTDLQFFDRNKILESIYKLWAKIKNKYKYKYKY